jgi:hypothetical protein
MSDVSPLMTAPERQIMKVIWDLRSATLWRALGALTQTLNQARRVVALVPRVRCELSVRAHSGCSLGAARIDDLGVRP